MVKEEEEGSEEDGYELKLHAWKDVSRDGIKVDEEIEPEENEKEEEDDQDDEANADLSLQIVEKAGQRRKTSSSGWRLGHDGIAVNLMPDGEDEDFLDIYSSTSVEDVDGKAAFAGRSETPEDGELQEDAEGNLVLAAELRHSPGKLGNNKRQRRKREKWKKKRRAVGDKIDGAKGDNKDEIRGLIDGNAVEESMVMRRLLRGPRYFDPPEEQGQSCFNCGKVGHMASACPEGPREKPCYVCGEFGHDGRLCPQKIDCYVCGKVGHIAKNCPNKGSVRDTSVRDTENVCLLCGDSGHEASICYRSYDPEDLAKVQCYVCEKFGHLCCLRVIDHSPLPVSCFNCGEMGHTGVRCTRAHKKEGSKAPPSVCFKCGVEGHYARTCPNKHRRPWPTDEKGLAGAYPLSTRYQSDSDGQWMNIQARDIALKHPLRISTEDRWTGSGHILYGRHSTRGVDANVDGSTWSFDEFGDSPRDRYLKRRRR